MHSSSMIMIIVRLLGSCSIVLAAQTNLYLTDRLGDNALQNHCLYLPVPMEKEIDSYELLTYCLSENLSKWKIEENHIDQKFTFAQLDRGNFTSEQLYRWSAPLDVAERYQSYLHQRSISSEFFYNCSSPRFGPSCEYSLDIPQPSDHISLQEILEDYYYQKEYEPTTLTCYEHLNCHRGSADACLDWSEICDGYVDCLNDAIDEENCWQLEINECADDEYRCSNGQCIAKIFFRDHPHSFECLDRSDGTPELLSSLDPIQQIPSFVTEDIICPLRVNRVYVKTTSSCVRQRDVILKEIMFIDTPKNLSDICWLAFKCISVFLDRIDPQCEQLCANKSCQQIISKQCPEMIIMPAKPLIFGHIYVAYMTKNISNSNIVFHPHYVCYNDKLCGGFLPNKTLLTFNNLTCRRPEDFPISPILIGRFSQIDMLLRALYIQTHQCNTIIDQNVVGCNNSTMYQCLNSSKCISKYRLCDGQIDCDYKDDEHCPLINGTCHMHAKNLLFPCPASNKCISLKQVDDGQCDCDRDQYGLCDDEQSTLRTIRKHISFSTICDGFLELISIVIDGRNETDETECQYWQCNNTYTRCDGFWNCFDGADEIDCDPSPFIECPVHHHLCISLDTYQLMCLPIEKSNDGIIDCLGATDEPKLCRSNDYQLTSNNFYCRDDPIHSCVSTVNLCYTTTNCAKGDNTIICDRIGNNTLIYSVCRDQYALTRTKPQNFLCQRTRDTEKSSIIYFSLDRRRQSTSPSFSRSSIVSLPRLYEYRCHRGIPIRVWLNLSANVSDIACLCPPSFYGSQCQYQNQRVSLTIQFQTFSHSRRTLFALVISLIDDSPQRIIHAYQQMTFLYTQHCQRKFNIYLLYSTRPKLSRRNYSIHIDIYEKISLAYSGSLLIPISMPFLPVHRIAVLRYIPRMLDSTPACSNQECVHGQCMKYFNDPNETTFCRCEQGWTGKYCTIPHTCHCSSDSFCAGISANNRSICICPVNKWGTRCLLHNPICQVEPNATCLNGGRCNALDENAPINEQFICICPKGFSGKRCEQTDHTLTISFDENIILPQSILLHFIRVMDNALPENGSTYKTIPVDRQSLTIQWPRPFHIAFVELFDHIYYLIIVQKTNHTPKNLTKTIHSSDRCPHISEVLNDTIANYHPLRRIKYYHLPCQRPTPIISCFFDVNHFCLCEQFGQARRISNCFEFNSTMKHDCFGQSNCENGGRCFQDRSICAQTSTCLCPKCFFGSRCQFSSNLFGLSLDAILASHIQPHISITDQPSIVKVSIALIIILNIVGLINGILSWITFRNQASQKVGCGLYLLVISIVTLLLVIILTMKFSILLVAQMTYMTNASFLQFQCISMDFLLNVCLIVYDWLGACVAIERAFAIGIGTKFHKMTSRKAAKYIIPCLILLLSMTMIHDPISRHLLYDDHDDEEEKRIWCIVTYSSSFQVLSNIINMMHFLTPFALNIISAIIIIVFTARQRSYLHTKTTYRNHLRQQFSQHRHLFIAPILLTILALPRLIISFLANCTDANTHAWLFLFGYFISFCPSMLTLFVFVLPSKFHKNEFWNSIKHYTRMMRSRLHFYS